MPLRPRGLCSILKPSGQSLPNPHEVTIWQIFGRAHTVRMLVSMIIRGNLYVNNNDNNNNFGQPLPNSSRSDEFGRGRNLVHTGAAKKKIKETVAFRVRYMYQAQALLTPARSLWL